MASSCRLIVFISYIGFHSPIVLSYIFYIFMPFFLFPRVGIIEKLNPRISRVFIALMFICAEVWQLIPVSLISLICDVFFFSHLVPLLSTSTPICFFFRMPKFLCSFFFHTETFQYATLTLFTPDSNYPENFSTCFDLH